MIASSSDDVKMFMGTPRNRSQDIMFSKGR